MHNFQERNWGFGSACEVMLQVLKLWTTVH